MQTIEQRNALQDELAPLLERRNELSRQTRQALHLAAQTRTALVQGRATTEEAARAREHSIVLQESLGELEEQISSLELTAQEIEEQVALEAKAVDLARLADVATQQRQELFELMTTAHKEFLRSVEQILEADGALTSTRKSFHAILFDAGGKDATQILLAAGVDVREVDLKAVLANWDQKPNMQPLGFALEMAVAGLEAERRSFNPWVNA